MSKSSQTLPAWVDAGLLPVLNVVAAFVVSGVLIAIMGANPLEALYVLLNGAFGYPEATGYTLYYATNFIFTGLAVSVAYHAGLFNIGGEGQAVLGGIGLTVGIFLFDGAPAYVVLPAAIVGGALFGALWAVVPAWLQARRGSHIVITTIMFNFIASALLSYLLVGPLQREASQMPESEDFPLSAVLPHMHDVFAALGWHVQESPLNMSLVVALVLAFAVWFLMQRMRLGYEIRVVGHNPNAARFAGISVTRITVIAMAISGALAGLMGLNELMGEQHRLIGNFTLGYGFVGIAVAFMGRNHPFGIVLAAVLFGVLYQGGTELSFEMGFPQDLIVMVQGLVILFAGAMEHMFRKPVSRLVRAWLGRSRSAAVKEAN